MRTDNPDVPSTFRIGIVGPCTAGKSTLIKSLSECGIQARHIAQEHSYVQNMWKRMTNPDILVFLDVTYPVSLIRRNINWTLQEYLEEQRRLLNAREHANLYILTDNLSPLDVITVVLTYISTYSKTGTMPGA